MDTNDFLTITDNEYGAYSWIEAEVNEHDTPEALGEAIRDMVQSLVPEDGSLMGLLWPLALEDVDWREVGEHYWEDLRAED